MQISLAGHSFWCKSRPEITNLQASLSQAGNIDRNRPNRSLSDGFFNIMPASISCPEVMSANMSLTSIFEFVLLPFLVDLLKIKLNRLPAKHGEYCFLPTWYQKRCPSSMSFFCELPISTIVHNDNWTVAPIPIVNTFEHELTFDNVWPFVLWSNGQWPFHELPAITRHHALSSRPSAPCPRGEIIQHVQTSTLHQLILTGFKVLWLEVVVSGHTRIANQNKNPGLEPLENLDILFVFNRWQITGPSCTHGQLKFGQFGNSMQVSSTVHSTCWT